MAFEIVYEVLAWNEDGAWELRHEFHNRRKALESVPAIVEEGTSISIKVIEVHRTRDGRASSRSEILEHDCSEPLAPSILVPAIWCQSPKDLYKPEARELIGNVLSDLLRRWSLTPIELLYSPNELRRVMSQGRTLQFAVQQIAILLSKDNPHPVTAIIREINSLVETTVNQIFEERKQTPLPNIIQSDLSTIIDELDASEDPGHILSGAIAAELSTIGSPVEKVHHLTKLAGTLPTGSRIYSECMDCIDEFIAEQLTPAANLTKLLGEHPDLGSALMYIANLCAGNSGELHTEDLDHVIISRFVGGQKLPKTRKILVKRVLDQFSSQKRLSNGSIESEIALTDKLSAFLKEECEQAGNKAMLTEGLRKRFKLISSDNIIGQYFEECGPPLQRLTGLVELANWLTDESSRDTLTGYFRAVVTSNAFQAIFLDGQSPIVSRLLQLRDIQEELAKSALKTEDRDRLVEEVGRLAGEVVTRDKFFLNLDKSPTSLSKKAEALIRMLATNSLPAGQCVEVAKQRINRYIRHPDFLDDLVGNLLESSEPGVVNRLERLESFAQMFDEAKVDALHIESDRAIAY